MKMDLCFIFGIQIVVEPFCLSYSTNAQRCSVVQLKLEGQMEMTNAETNVLK